MYMLIMIADKISKLLPPSSNDTMIEAQYREDCERISKAVAPLEQIQVVFIISISLTDFLTKVSFFMK